jgi:apolipoprotein N-acyltransferase
LNKIEEPKTFSEVIVIQPNVDPYDEKYELTNEDFKNSLINLTSELITDKTSFVVTPETFFTERSGFDIDVFENSQFNISLKEFIASHKNLNLISGTQFYKLYRSKNEPTETANKIQEGFWADFYNSAILSAPKQKSQIYHKSKLVVGVENMPYKSFFKPLLGEFMLDLGGTVSSRAIQSERTVFSHSINETKVAPIICYESIYGEYVTEYARNGADFFTILTNDAWWGNTQGHKQLLSYARLRAIENRRSIARSANTGISAFINHKGEIIKTLPYEEKGALIGKVGLNKNLTFYSRYGDYIARIANFTFFLLLLSCLASILRRKK